jgi:hypothetical protein
MKQDNSLVPSTLQQKDSKDTLRHDGLETLQQKHSNGFALERLRSSSNTSDSSTCTPYDGLAPLKPWLAQSNNIVLSLFCIVASFSTYFCVYAFRKAVFAHTYEFAGGWFGSGMSFKTAISLMQTLGLTMSKISGIKYHCFVL